MSPWLIAALTFVSLAAAGMAGHWLSLDASEARTETRDSVRLMQTVVSSMAAMLLGLLVASSTQHYRSQEQALVRLASEVAMLDRMMVEYGPQAAAARAALRRGVEHFVAELRASGGHSATPAPRPSPFDEILALQPATPRQTFLHGKSLDQVLTVERSRTALVTANQGSAIQFPLIIMLISWFGWVFLATNLFASGGIVVRIATLCGSLAVAGGLFMIIELDSPFTGMLALSDDVLVRALDAARP